MQVAKVLSVLVTRRTISLGEMGRMILDAQPEDGLQEDRLVESEHGGLLVGDLLCSLSTSLGPEATRADWQASGLSLQDFLPSTVRL